VSYKLPPSDLIQDIASITETEIEAKTKTGERDSFNIDHCESYQNQWLKDLDNSCVAEEDGAQDCRCDDAQRRIESGQIETSSLCPDDCEVCKFCLDSVLGFRD